MNITFLRTSNLNTHVARKAGSLILILAMWILTVPILPTRAQTTDKPKAISLSAKQDRNEVVSIRFKDHIERVFGNVKSPSTDDQIKQVKSRGQEYTFANVEFKTAKAREATFPANKSSRISGISVVTVFDRFADIFISTSTAFDRLIESPGILWVDGLKDVVAPPPPPYSKLDAPSKAVPDRIVRDGFQGLKGKDVIIAIVDSGVDFRHPDFIKYDSAGKPVSRLLYLWNTGLDHRAGRGNPAPFSFPNNAPVGTLFTQAQLTAELRRMIPTIPGTDLDGHGTACASIAAGNGNADKGEDGLKRSEVVGVAPEADIIGISLDAAGDGGLSGSYMLNAMSEWLDKVAGSKPLVVSNSWGSHWYGHDGQTVFERQLDARFSLDKKGRAILFAAGNEGQDDFHASLTLPPGKKASASWVSKSQTAPMRVYFDTANPNVDVDPGPASLSQVVSPLSNQILFRLNYPGTGTVEFTNVDTKPVKVDIYLPQGRYGFNLPSRSRSGMIGFPGTMRNAITVGSYDWNDNFHLGGKVAILPGLACIGGRAPLVIGDISCYSSPGPTRDGRLKPEIVSPGQWFSSSHAKVNGKPVSPDWADTTGNYMLMNGTSAATPYTAGIVALMFEKKADLTFGEIRTLLEKNASRDPFTGVPPGAEWGSGKLDMRAVGKIFAEIK